MTRPSALHVWPRPHDPASELNWGDPVISRRLLREHLDERHDSASRRPHLVEAHLRRLRRLLPKPPARLLDAACGPGLYAVPLAEMGYDVTGVDVGPAVIRHARSLARSRHVADHCDFITAGLLDIEAPQEFDAVLLIYHVLESFPRRDQPAVVRHLRDALLPGGVLIAEMRLRPNHPEGRLSSWEVAETSLLADRRHLLICDSAYDAETRTYVLRETAVFDDGSTASQQTTSQFSTLKAIPSLFRRGGLEVEAVYEGWSRHLADESADTVMVVARRPA